MPIDLTKRLIKPETDSGELECFLSSSFGTSGQTEPDRVVHGSQVAIEYSKKKKIKKIEWLDDAATGRADKLVQDADVALYGDFGKEIAQRFFFAGKSIQGVMRIRDDFQIAPLPDESPRPKFLAADHPGLLEFSFRKSSHNPIEHYRREAREQELKLVLRAILGPGFTSRSKYLKHEWVHVKTNGNLTSEYCQIGYLPGDLWKTKDGPGFSVNDTWQTVEKISSESYYAMYGGGDKRNFVVPDTFEQSYEMFNSLLEDDRGQFLRSAHWYKTSSEVFHSSRSLAYAVLVFALEALMPPAQEGDECETCGIPKRDSIGQRFQAFLDTYCSGLPKDKIKEFASMRSKYVHGGSLMLSDAEATGFCFSAPLNAERDHFGVLQHVCHIALLNWLHDRANS
ncbi:MAG: hypothetical protein ISR48_02880 [Alphaproteobacteria bacterium]|nr:hypothetical protein [Alphaproteobacteria bacterium]